MQSEDVKLEYLDDLSGLFNRRYLRRVKEEFINNLLASRSPFTLSIVDIDHFKEVNDTYGHMKGDEVIASFSRFLKENLRAEDIIIRYGGDEFLVVQEGLGGETAFAVWEDVIKKIHRERFGGLNITISAGIAVYPEDGSSYDELFLRADERLYIAKRTGRGKLGRETLKKIHIPPRDFVNRKVESEDLRSAVIGGEIALVRGEAGIGKTRLIREVLRKFDDIEVLWSDCIAVDNKLPYYPLRELVKYKIARDGTEVFREMPAALKIEIGKIVPGMVKEISDEELRTLGSALDKYRLYEAFTYVFNAGTRKKVIVIDNIQWIDSDSVDALKYILLSSGENVRFVFAERSGEHVPYLERFINGIQRTYSLKKIELLPFENENVKSLLRVIVGEAVPEFENYIIPRGGGNPFYIEELVKVLNKEGYLREESGKWVFTAPDNELLPGGIEGVIKEKFSGLSHDAQEVVKVVSVAGKGYVELLRDILGYNEGRVFGAIEEGIKSTLLREGEREDVVEFKYGMARQIIYNTELNNITRMHLHKKVAEWLESHMREEAEEEIAYHYYLAGVKEKIIEYGERAGDKASNLYADEKALDYYEWAENNLMEDASGTPASPQYARILVKKAGILRKLGNLLQAEEFLKKALNFAKNVGIPEIEKIAGTLLRGVLWNLGKISVSGEMDLARVSSTTEVERNDQEEKISSNSPLSHKFGGIGGVVRRLDEKHGISRKIKEKLKDSGVSESNVAKEASQYYKKAKGLFGKYAKRLQDIVRSDDAENEKKEQISYRDGSGIALHLGYRLGEELSIENIAVLLAVKGDFDNAEKYLLSALQDTEDNKDLKSLSFIYNNLGLVYKAKGRLKEGLKNLIEAEKLAEKVVDKAGETLYKMNIGALLTIMGSYSTAMNMFENAYNIAEKIDMKNVLSQIVRNTLKVYLAQGEPEKAMLILGELEEEGTDGFDERDLLLTKAEVLLWNRDLAPAFESLKRLDEILPRKGALPLRIEKAFLDVQYMLLSSQYEEAHAYLDNLYYLLKGYPDKLYLADYYRLMGIAYCHNNKVKSLKLFNMAIDLYKEMGLKHRIEEVVSEQKRCYANN